MQSNSIYFQPISVQWKPGFHFIRKGQVAGEDCQLLFKSESEEDILFRDMISKRYPDEIPDWLCRVV